MAEISGVEVCGCVGEGGMERKLVWTVYTGRYCCTYTGSQHSRLSFDFLLSLGLAFPRSFGWRGVTLHWRKEKVIPRGIRDKNCPVQLESRFVSLFLAFENTKASAADRWERESADGGQKICRTSGENTFSGGPVANNPTPPGPPSGTKVYTNQPSESRRPAARTGGGGHTHAARPTQCAAQEHSAKRSGRNARPGKLNGRAGGTEKRAGGANDQAGTAGEGRCGAWQANLK